MACIYEFYFFDKKQSVIAVTSCGHRMKNMA
jgi:hypothetical protein